MDKKTAAEDAGDKMTERLSSGSRDETVSDAEFENTGSPSIQCTEAGGKDGIVADSGDALAEADVVPSDSVRSEQAAAPVSSSALPARSPAANGRPNGCSSNSSETIGQSSWVEGRMYSSVMAASCLLHVSPKRMKFDHQEDNAGSDVVDENGDDASHAELSL